jgi:hypothetical protein
MIRLQVGQTSIDEQLDEENRSLVAPWFFHRDLTDAELPTDPFIQ